MTLDEIQAQADKDLVIDDTELDTESLKTPILHPDCRSLRFGVLPSFSTVTVLSVLFLAFRTVLLLFSYLMRRTSRSCELFSCRFLAHWIMVGLFLIIYEIFFTLYRLCFGSIAKGVWYLVELFISGYFMSDVCVQSRSERPRAAREGRKGLAGGARGPHPSRPARPACVRGARSARAHAAPRRSGEGSPPRRPLGPCARGAGRGGSETRPGRSR